MSGGGERERGVAGQDECAVARIVRDGKGEVERAAELRDKIIDLKKLLRDD